MCMRLSYKPKQKKFYEEHQAELSLYDTALRTLKEKSVGNKLPSMKHSSTPNNLVEILLLIIYSHNNQDFLSHTHSYHYHSQNIK
jgi:hypothetical protein